MIDIKELKFDEHNFNRHNDEGMSLLEKSIKENGLGRSILLDKDNNIVGGNGVTEKAIELGKTKVRIIETDGSELIAVKRTDLTLDSEQGRKMALADNSVAHANLEWNEEELQKAQDDWGLVPEEWGVEMPDLQLLEEDDNSFEDEFDEQEDNVEPVCKDGDLWKLGEHRLLCGDSTLIDSCKRLMGGQLADLWLTDPPYNVAYEGATAEKLTIMNDSMDDEKFRAFLLDAFTAAVEVMKTGAAFYIWHADTEGFNFRYAVKNAGLQLKQCLIWNKNQLVMGRQDYQWKHEPCLYGWKDGGSHHWYSDRKQTTVLNFDKPLRNADHPTMKPVPLFGYLIQNSSKDGDIILDTFGGSGTTLIACEQLGRKCRMMELDPHYCDVIIARWEKLTGNKAEKMVN